MKKQRILAPAILTLMATFFYIACQKKYTLDLPVTEITSSVTASLSGRVLDENHLPVKSAAVKLGTYTTTTDLNGNFRFSNITVNNPDAAYVRVEKDGFFAGSRTYRAYAGSKDYVSIQLIKKATTGSFNASSGGSITVPNSGGKIDFQANAIVNPVGNISYTGTVSVAAFFINPAATDFQEIMPGTLRGIDSSNKQVGLQSFGMMAIELTGGTGEKLQLATGKTATITFPIQSGLQAQAPATIPLWSFNETTGLWKREGVAVRQGANYVGTVGHFSFWNCDFPLPIVKFNAVYITQDGLAIPYSKVVIKTVDDAISTSGYGYTDSAGILTGTIPASKTMLATLYNRCGDPIDVRYIGPFISDVKVGTLTVKTTAKPLVRYTGTVVNCTGAPVASGFVDLLVENTHFFAPVANGNFSLSATRCSAGNTTATIMAYDDANIVQSVPTQLQVNDTIVRAGQLTACGTALTEYLNYKLSGASNIFTAPADSVSVNSQSGNLSVWFSRKAFQLPVDEFYLSFKPTGVGTAPLTSVSVTNNNFRYGLSVTTTTTITEYGPVGGFISGNFATDLKRDSSAAATYPITANFRVRRIQ